MVGVVSGAELAEYSSCCGAVEVAGELRWSWPCKKEHVLPSRG